MRSTTLFGLFASGFVILTLGLAGLALYSLERARWWDARTQLAHDSYALHLQLEVKLFRLFKQHGDALLIGDRDGGASERDLRDQIASNIAGIREIIGREILMVGEQEIEELVLLDAIEEDIRIITLALESFSASGQPIEAATRIERLADLLDRRIDVLLGQKIDAALSEEREEVAETIAEAEAFKTRNRRLVYVILGLAALLLGAMLILFQTQVRRPLTRLGDSLERLRSADYTGPFALGGSEEFRALGHVLDSMAEALSTREATREEHNRVLDETVAARTYELQRLVGQLEIGEENRKQLMADISHELRTPLAIVLGEADVALRTATDMRNDVSDALARIRDAARHTNQIVDDLLTIARHEAGQLRLDRRELDLRKIVHDAASMFPRAVEIDMPVEPIRLHADEVRLRQCILALLHNARRYGGPRIRASIVPGASAVEIAVEDDGPGLSGAEKAHAFDRFFRGSNASGQGIEGSGLGLPIVRSIVMAHGGDVRLEDREGGGLRAVIELPRQPRMTLIGQAGARISA